MAVRLTSLFSRAKLVPTALIQCKRSILTPPNAGEPTKTSRDIIDELTTGVIGGSSTYSPESFQEGRQRLMAILPRSQADLPARRMSDSFDQAIIPLGSDPVLRDKYITHLGSVRIGRLLEDMDVFAVHLVFKHILNPLQPPNSSQSPFSIVTALVDRIRVQSSISPDQDIKMAGHVTWVGKSSIESTLNLHQKRNGKWELVMEAAFVMVSRDPLNVGSSYVNPLIAETEAEKKLVALGNLNKRKRMVSSGDSLFKAPPTEEEKILVHDFFIKTVDHKTLSFKARVIPDHHVWMEDAKLKNVILCQPEYRNRFNKIFGGFLMRQAFELGWSNAYVYARQRPYIEFMDDILFQAPVEIGSLLLFNSQVAYVEDRFIQVRVSAEVLDPHTGTRKMTNVFHYTFSTKDGVPPKIMPKTYHDSMLFLDGRRHFEAFQSSVRMSH